MSGAAVSGFVASALALDLELQLAMSKVAVTSASVATINERLDMIGGPLCTVDTDGVRSVLRTTEGLMKSFCVVADGDAVYARFHVASGLIADRAATVDRIEDRMRSGPHALECESLAQRRTGCRPR